MKAACLSQADEISTFGTHYCILSSLASHFATNIKTVNMKIWGPRKSLQQFLYLLFGIYQHLDDTIGFGWSTESEGKIKLRLVVV